MKFYVLGKCETADILTHITLPFIDINCKLLHIYQAWISGQHISTRPSPAVHSCTKWALLPGNRMHLFYIQQVQNITVRTQLTMVWLSFNNMKSTVGIVRV